MGAQWKQAGRVANAMKRGQVIGKLVREILIASKLGGPDPDLNARLYAAIEAARKASVPRDTIDPFTPRERSVLRLVALGRTNRQVGEELFISEKTVSVHLSRIMAKLGATRRTEAVAIASERGLLES